LAACLVLSDLPPPFAAFLGGMPLLSKRRTLDAINSKHTGNKAGNVEMVKSRTDQAWNRLFQKGGQAVNKLNNNVDEATA